MVRALISLAAAGLAGGPTRPPQPDPAVVRQLDRTWERLSQMQPRMGSRSLFDFALEAAAAGYAPDRITRVLALAECMQDRIRESRTYGNFKWYWHAEKPQDRNAVEFCMQKGILVRMLYRDRLDAEGQDVLERLIRFSVEGIRRHTVRESYTNIYLMKAWNCIAIGENTDRPELARTGRQMLARWLLYTWEGGIHEYGSPTYYGTDLESLGLIARHAKSPEARRHAETALRLLWTDIAANWFAPCQRLGGAHSRDYDYLTGQGHLHRLLRATGWLPAEKGWRSSTFFSLCRWAPPQGLTKPIVSTVPRTVQQRWGPDAGQTAVHYVGRSFSLGSAGANYGPMDKVLSLQFAGGPKMPVANFLMDARGDPYGKKKELTGGGHSKAFHLTPLVTSAQRGPEVLLLASADPNTPRFRRFAPSPSCLLSHLVIPTAVGVWIGETEAKGDQALDLPAGGPVFLRFRDVAVGVWMRPGPARLISDGGKYAVRRLTVTHADGPPTDRATVAVWVRAAEGLDDTGFAAFRKAFRGPLAIKRTGPRVDAVAGALHVAADVVARRALVARGGEPGTDKRLLAVNGRDHGREILSKVPGIARYQTLIESVAAAAEDAPKAGGPIEAEAAAIIVPPFRVDADQTASGGRFVWMPGEPGGKGGSSLGRAVWLVHVPAGGQYGLSARVRTPTPSDDSFFVRVRQAGRDVLPKTDWHTGRHTKWQWAEVTPANARSPLRFRLERGVAVVEFSCREDGAMLDAVRLAPAEPDQAR